MNIHNENILDYLIINIVDDILTNKRNREDLLKSCYNYQFIDRARKILPSEINKALFLNKINEGQVSKDEENILFNIIQAYNLTQAELSFIKGKLLTSVSGLFAYFSFSLDYKEIDFLNAIDFIESNWEKFRNEEVIYEDPKKTNFDKTAINLLERINQANQNKKWIYLFSNLALKEMYQRGFLNKTTQIEIVKSYNNHSVFSEKLNLKFIQ
jgi:hypothetical protein